MENELQPEKQKLNKGKNEKINKKCHGNWKAGSKRATYYWAKSTSFKTRNFSCLLTSSLQTLSASLLPLSFSLSLSTLLVSRPLKMPSKSSNKQDTQREERSLKTPLGS
uniref:Uncharacterized protein n=1 Tax=Opuntia streptacantha TaxID=393608 RepID=A0A7C8ZCV6_OPUST